MRSVVIILTLGALLNALPNEVYASLGALPFLAIFGLVIAGLIKVVRNASR